MNLFYQPDLPEGVNYLDSDESRHAMRVLRLHKGDHIEVTDGRGSLYHCQIVTENPNQCYFSVTEKTTQESKTYTIHIAIAPTKNTERIEWFVEKSTEIGIQEISFMLCEKSERRNLNHERIQKIAISAIKQSQQVWLPKINTIRSFNEMMADTAEQKFIAYVDQTNPDHLKALVSTSKNYLILIGPEGDFSKEELALSLRSGFQKVSLGANRLRTETAGLAACHILNLVN